MDDSDCYTIKFTAHWRVNPRRAVVARFDDGTSLVLVAPGVLELEKIVVGEQREGAE